MAWGVGESVRSEERRKEEEEEKVKGKTFVYSLTKPELN
jgi:hypothetical protein